MRISVAITQDETCLDRTAFRLSADKVCAQEMGEMCLSFADRRIIDLSGSKIAYEYSMNVFTSKDAALLLYTLELLLNSARERLASEVVAKIEDCVAILSDVKKHDVLPKEAAPSPQYPTHFFVHKDTEIPPLESWLRFNFPKHEFQVSRNHEGKIALLGPSLMAGDSFVIFEYDGRVNALPPKMFDDIYKTSYALSA